MKAKLLSALALAAIACGSARRSLPIAGPFEPRAPALVRGEEVFFRNCHTCHPHGEAGLGPALNDKPLPGFLIRFQVRHGIGPMPAFSDREIPDDDLDRLISYLKALRAHG